MSAAYGPDTVTFISRAPGTGYVAGSGAVLAETRIDVSGCLHRPITPPAGGSPATEEDPEVGVSVGTEWWQSTCPPVAAAMACQASDVIEVNGHRYVVITGARPHGDFRQPVKVTIVSERQTIG